MVSERSTHPNASHFHFPYFFTTDTAGTPIEGFKFTDAQYIPSDVFLYLNGDLILHWTGFNPDDSATFIDCWCSDWKISNYEFSIETWLTKEDSDKLKAHIVPGAVRELYSILGNPQYIDTTYDASNTITIVPNIYTYKKSGSSYNYSGNNRSILNQMISTTTIFPKTLSEGIINGDSSWINIKIEGFISGSTL